MFMMKECFDRIVSLGYNCEVSFRIRDYLDRPIDSYPLSWSYILDQSLMPQILDAMYNRQLTEGQFRIQENGMVFYPGIQSAFHLKHKKQQKTPADEKKPYAVRDEIEELKSRMLHLQNKYIQLLNGDESVLFVVKVQDRDLSGGFTEEQICENIRQIESHLGERKKNGQYRILAVLRERSLTKQIESISGENLVIDAVPCFALDSNTEKGGCIDDWIMLLEYYNNKELKDELGRSKRLYSSHMEQIRDKYTLKRIEQITEKEKMIRALEEEKKAAEMELKDKTNELYSVYNSKSWLIGRAITHIPRRFQMLFGKSAQKTQVL